MSTPKHLHVGAELCEVFGEDPHLVKSLDMHFGVNDVATVTIHRYVSKGEYAALAPTLKNFNIVPAPAGASTGILVGKTEISPADQAVQKAASND